MIRELDGLSLAADHPGADGAATDAVADPLDHLVDALRSATTRARRLGLAGTAHRRADVTGAEANTMNANTVDDAS